MAPALIRTAIPLGGAQRAVAPMCSHILRRIRTARRWIITAPEAITIRTMGIWELDRRAINLESNWRSFSSYRFK